MIEFRGIETAIIGRKNESHREFTELRKKEETVNLAHATTRTASLRL